MTHNAEQKMSVVPYYEDEWATIYHGDARDLLPRLFPLPLSAVLVTDPPYGMAFVSNRHGKRFETEATANRPVSIVGDEDTLLRDDILGIWGDRPALVFGTWKCPRPERARHVLTWVKGDHLGMGDLSIPWRPNTEEIYVVGTGFVGHRGTSALNYPAPVSWASRGRLHPHQKPLALMKALIEKCPEGPIIDPFMGSGSTLCAAKNLGRKTIGFDVDERYCETAAARLQGKRPDIRAEQEGLAI